MHRLYEKMKEAQSVKPVEKKEIVLVCSDDWEGLYINGKLVYESHSVPLDTFAKHVGVELIEKQADYDWLDYRSRLPDNLSEVKFAQ